MSQTKYSMREDLNEVTRAALEYARLGLDVHEVHPGTKKPAGGKGWNSAERLTAEKIPRAFAERADGSTPNVGVRLGPASGDIVDLDLDKPEAERLVAWFAAFREAPTYGHGDSPRSHKLCVVPGARTRKIADIDNSTLLEVRAFNGDLDSVASHQSILPPSVHPDGTRYEWPYRSKTSKASPGSSPKYSTSS